MSLFSSAIVRLVAVRSISIWVIDHPRGLLVKPKDSSSSAATVYSNDGSVTSKNQGLFG